MSIIASGVVEVLRSGFITQGSVVPKFEDAVTSCTNADYGVAVNSGTAALHIACQALGLGPGDLLWTTTNSFVASANCGLYCGASVDFVDIELESGLMSPMALEEKLIKAEKAGIQPKIVIPVHFAGQSCDMHAIHILSQQYGFRIIEDACQAHGAMYKNKKVGSISDVGCFSFYPTKNMTVGGDGGMVTTNNEEIKKQIDSLRDNGRRTRTEHDKLGFTMRLNTVNAAIGRVQLRHLDEKNQRRREIAMIYRKKLTQDCILPENRDGKSVYHQIIIKHKKRNEIKNELAESEIGSAIYYEKPIHLQPYYPVSYTHLTLPTILLV